MIYYIYFQVEQVVEEGWLRPEEEYIQEFDEMKDTLSQELGDRREKRQRTEESEGQLKRGIYKQVNIQGKFGREGGGNKDTK
jgi:hypothetical protein